MDLIKAFTEKYQKAEPPVVEIGDTVRVHLKVKEGNRERIQVFEGTIIAKQHGGIEETSPSAVFLTVSAWRRCSPCMLPPSRRWSWFATVRSAGPSCITCAAAWARLPRLKKPCNPQKERTARPAPFLFKYNRAGERSSRAAF